MTLHRGYRDFCAKPGGAECPVHDGFIVMNGIRTIPTYFLSSDGCFPSMIGGTTMSAVSIGVRECQSVAF